MKSNATRCLFLSALLASVTLAPLGRAQSAPPAPAALPAQLDLQSAVRYALDHNYAILQAREVIRQQEGLIMQVKGQEIPNVDATGSYLRNARSISTITPAETSEYTVLLKATQAIYAGGGIDSSVRNAKYLRDAATFDLQTAINTALLDVRTRFYTVLLAREQVRVQEENVQLFQRELTDARHQFHAGTVSNFEVLRAQVSLANAQPDLISARNNYRIAIEQLRQSLGVPSGPSGGDTHFPEVVGTLAYKPEPSDLESALATAHERRPELLRLGKVKDANEEGVTTARSNYYPNLSAYGGYEFGGIGLAAGGSSNANGWELGLQSSWAIFDGHSTAGRVRQARSILNQSKLSYDSEELAIDVEVRQALSTLQDSTELVQASQKTVEEAAEALRLANARYHAGSATQLDVLTSQVSLTQAKTNELQAYYNYSVSVAAAHKAMGLSDALVGD